MIGRWLVWGLLVVTALAAVTVDAKPGRYLSVDAFLDIVFEGREAESKRLIVDSDIRSRMEEILQHRYQGIRIRYWQSGETTAWVLEEIGKTEPITIGVAIRDQSVAAVRVLTFRESRGWEIRQPFFTGQFEGLSLGSDLDLDRRIDGITGATLSVNAVDRVVRLALLLDGIVADAAGASLSDS